VTRWRWAYKLATVVTDAGSAGEAATAQIKGDETQVPTNSTGRPLAFATMKASETVIAMSASPVSSIVSILPVPSGTDKTCKSTCSGGRANDKSLPFS
jgi:hypothetical protein